MKALLKRKEFSLFMIVVVICILISMLSNVFLTTENLVYLVKNNLVMWMMSLGMLLVIISGGIDVSVSANICTVTVVIGKLMVSSTQTNLFMILLIACATGAAIGCVNGLIISKLKIPPIVTTLGTLSIINGLILMITNGNWITNLPQWFKDFGKIGLGTLPGPNGTSVKIPVQFLFLLFAIVLTWFILRYTLIGRGVYAIGGNITSAERVGYKPDRITVFIYGYLGFLSGIAGVVHTSMMEQVDPNAFLNTEMMVVAAVVIGGANVMGGSGTVLGTMLGSLLLAILNNGMVLARVPTFWQKIVVGAIIVFAISYDMIQRKKEQSKLVKVDVDQEER